MDKLTLQIQKAKEAAHRRKRALKLRRQDKTLQEIGDTLGVSRQRAEQLVKEALRDEATPRAKMRGTGAVGAS